MRVMNPTRSSLGPRRTGLLLALATAVISGVAIFVNAYGVRAWAGTASPTTYTTFKNLFAAFILLGVGLVATRRRSAEALVRPRGTGQWIGLVGVAVFGGAVAFALFFEGLARAASTQAAFIHKSLVIWVAILAVGFLRERFRPAHALAIALLVIGQILLAGGFTDVGFGVGELMILAATLLWSIEIVVAKRLLSDVSSLTVGVARMAGGAVVLVVYGVVSGGVAAVGAVSMSQIGWVAVTGAALAAYVGSWYAALARASAIDVTSVLVGGAIITAILGSVVNGAPLGSPLGLGLVAAGVATVIVAGRAVAATSDVVSDLP
jgi:drug/metabolite transporter (DMT)-like permease